MNLFLPQYKNSIITVTKKNQSKGSEYDNREKYGYKLLPDLSGRDNIYLGEFAGSFLQKAVIPEHIKKLEEGAFLNCASLEYVEIPDGITKIPAGAFSGCTGLRKVRLPETLETIEDFGFYQCRSLEQIVLPDNLKKVGRKAFSGCNHLTYVVGGTNYRMGEEAFEGCFSLIKKQETPKGYRDKFTYEVDRKRGKVKIIKYIGHDSSVIVPGWIEGYPVRELADKAFAACQTLTCVELPNSLEALGEELFSCCSLLEQVSMPEIFGTNEIPACKGLEKTEAYAVCAGENDTVDFGDLTVSAAYGKDGKFVFRHQERGEVVFKNAVFTDPCVGIKKEGRYLVYGGRNITIPKGMFFGCSSLQKLTFSSYVTRIGEEAFAECHRLKEVVLPNGLKSLPEECFRFCISLTDIQGAEKLESIGRAAFSDCHVFDYARLPVTVREIGSSAFTGCDAIRFLKIFPQVETIGENAFYGCENMKSLLLFPQKLQIMDGAFSHCQKLKCVKVPKDCSRIGKNAFSECDCLKEIILPKEIDVIDRETLLFQEKLERVILKGDSLPEFKPEALPLLRNAAFFLKPGLLVKAKEAWEDKLPCKSLEASVYSDLYSYEEVDDRDVIKILQYIGSSAFVKVPEIIEGLPVAVIGKGAFENHKEIEEIILPDSVEEIQEKAFAGCEKLNYFILPGRVTHLGKEAFYMCTALRGITFLAKDAGYQPEEFSTCGKLRYITVDVETRPMGEEAEKEISKWEKREKFQVEIQENHAVITDYAGMKEDEVITEKCTVFIPEIMDGYPVCQIGKEMEEQDEYLQKGVFAGCEEIEALHFPPSVKKIGNGVFYHCTSLKHLFIPKGIRHIGKDSFRECAGLISVNMQAQEIEIGKKAFFGCKRLEAAAIWAESVKAEQGCFEECGLLEALFFHCGREVCFQEDSKEKLGNKKLVMAGLGEKDRKFSCEYEINEKEQTIGIVKYTGEEENVNVPGFLSGLPVTEIREEAFLNQTMPVRVNISSMVRKIGQGAFKGCSSLTRVTLPESMERLEKELFFMCVMLETAELPSMLKEIGENAFSGCRLSEIELPEKLKTIEKGAFSRCVELKKVILPKELKAIGTEAFSGCVKLRHIMLPAGISLLPENTFKDCTGLKSALFLNPDCEKKPDAFLGCSLKIETSCKNLPEEIKGDIHYLINQKCAEATIIDCQGEKEEIVIPDYAGESKTALRGTMPTPTPESENSVGGIPVTAVADIAFAWKKQIRRISIPENIQVIGSMAFYGCENLEEVVFLHKGEGPRIYKEAFFALRKAVIYFHSHECMEALKAENCTCPLFCIKGSCEPGEAFTYCFDRGTGELSIQPSKTVLPGEESWWTAKEQQEKEKKQDKGEYPWDCIRDRIKKVKLEENVTCVESGAFEDCGNLQEVLLPKSLIRIGQAAFKNCKKLSKIQLPENLESVGAEAFYGCISLTGEKERAFLLPDSLLKIEKKAFYGCTGLKDLLFPKSISEIGMGAFKKCSRLCDIYMEHSERPAVIGREVFYGVAKECEISVKFSNVSMLETKFDGNVMIHTPLEGACGKQEEGQDGSQVTWKLYYDGLLEITGDGDMADYNGSTTPWYEYGPRIQEISIKGNITYIGAMAFHSCNFLTAELPDGLRSIGMEAFAYCKRMEFIKIPAGVGELGTNCFRGCDSLKRVLFMTEGEACQVGISAFRDIGSECAFYISNESFAQKIRRSYSACTVKKIKNYERKTMMTQSNQPVDMQACLYEDGLLVMGSSGQGEIQKEQDWFFQKEEFEQDSVKALFLDTGICRLGKESFRKLSALKDAVIAGTVERIEERAFGANISNITFYTRDEVSERTLKYAGSRKVEKVSGFM